MVRGVRYWEDMVIVSQTNLKEITHLPLVSRGLVVHHAREREREGGIIMPTRGDEISLLRYQRKQDKFFLLLLRRSLHFPIIGLMAARVSTVET